MSASTSCDPSRASSSCRTRDRIRAFDEAIFAAPIGEPQLVQSSWGFHLILVTERGSGPPAITSPESAVAFDGSVAEPKDDAGKSL